MAKGLNKVMLIGNVGVDPEARYTPNGNAVVTISIATTESWKDKQTGENQDRTEWHRVVFFNRLAEIVNEYVRKGSKLYVEGMIRTRKWQDRDGKDRYTTEIIGNEMQMLDSRGSAAEGGHYQPQQQQQAAAPQPAAHAAPVDGPDFEDDIPF